MRSRLWIDWALGAIFVLGAMIVLVCIGLGAYRSIDGGDSTKPAGQRIGGDIYTTCYGTTRIYENDRGGLTVHENDRTCDSGG